MVYLKKDIFNIIKEYLLIDTDFIFINMLSTIGKNKHDNYLLDDNEKRNKKCNDKYLNKVSTYKFYKKIEFIKEDSSLIMFELPQLNEIDGNINFSIKTSLMYKNLQFEGNIDNIEWIELEVGGRRIDRINMEFYKTLQQFYKMDGIPFYSFKYGHFIKYFHITRILFKIKKPEKIILKVDEYHSLKYYLVTNQLLYINSKCEYFNVKDKDNVINLNFEHPTYFFLCNHKLENINLTFPLGNENRKKFKLYQYGQIIRLTLKLDSDDISNYSINFSRFDKIELEFDSPNSDKIILTSIHNNILQHRSFNAKYFFQLVCLVCYFILLFKNILNIYICKNNGLYTK